jgi:hypothetical protein
VRRTEVLSGHIKVQGTALALTSTLCQIHKNNQLEVEASSYLAKKKNETKSQALMSRACHHRKVQLRFFFYDCASRYLGKIFSLHFFLVMRTHISMCVITTGRCLFFLCSLASFAADSRAPSRGGDSIGVIPPYKLVAFYLNFRCGTNYSY